MGQRRQANKAKEYTDKHSAIIDDNIEWFKDTRPYANGPTPIRQLYPQIAAMADSLTPESFETVVYFRMTNKYYAVNEVLNALWPTQSVFSKPEYYEWVNDPDAQYAIGCFYLLTHLPTNITIDCLITDSYLLPKPGAVALTNYKYENGKYTKTA